MKKIFSLIMAFAMVLSVNAVSKQTTYNKVCIGVFSHI